MKPRASAATTKSTWDGGNQRGEAADGRVERLGVEQQRRDVPEEDPGAGKIRDVPNVGAQVHGRCLGRDLAQIADQQQVLEMRGDRGEVLERFDRLLAPVGIARAQGRREDALQ